MSFEFTGKTAVVTGAASGIGRATCVALAERGCDVVATDVDEVGLEGTAELISQTGRQGSTRVVDVANREAVFELAEWTERECGGAGVLVNNAGVTVIAELSDHSLEDFEWLMGINFWGVVYGCKAFLDQLAQRRGHIVNISSIFGVVGMPSQSSYCASKFAVRGFSESLRHELREKGVGVTSVHPGGVRTGIVESARADGRYVEDQRRSMKWFEKKAMDPSNVGDAIVRSIDKNEQRLIVAPGARFLDTAQRIWPAGLSTLLRWGKDRLRS